VISAAFASSNLNPNPTPTPAPRRQPGLDLLRAIAIAMVVPFHAAGFGFSLPYDVHRFGWVGVDLFFVLSGYLIGGQLLAQFQETGRIHFGRFYARRALRILPAYFVVLAVYFLLPDWRERPVISPLWKFILSVQNIDLRAGTAFTHAWSLAVEDQFYLILPCLLYWLVRSRRAAIWFPCSIVIGGFLLRTGLGLWLRDPAGHVPSLEYYRWIYYPSWTRLDPMVLGVALAAIERHRSSWWRTLTGCARWLWIPAFASVAAGLYLSDGDLTVVSCVWKFPLIALGMALFLVCAVSDRLPFNRVRVPGVAFLAQIAYSIYLSHKLVVHFWMGVCKAHAIAPSSVAGILSLDLLVLLVGSLLYFVVERPFLQLRHRIKA
jgi:peptidoglycan/LPS O-acetylase OafA/YrhL